MLQTFGATNQILNWGQKRKWYHRKFCPLIDNIIKNDLIACGFNPELAGFKPHSHCSPTPLKAPPKGPKRMPIGEILVEKALQYGMKASLSGPNIYITTIADEWFFNYTATPITLHHKNTEKRTDKYGRPYSNHHYIQSYTFTSPLEAFTYIYRHTENAANRSLSPAAGQLTLLRSPNNPPQLLCNDVSLQPGCKVEALFPNGWHCVTLDLRVDNNDLHC